MPDADRPQDVCRSHARKRVRGAADTALVERYQEALRTWLDRVVTELGGKPQPDGLLGPVPPNMPTTTEAGKLIELGGKIVAQLGNAIDTAPGTEQPEPPRRRSRNVDY
jgi:hypothetical protein